MGDAQASQSHITSAIVRLDQKGQLKSSNWCMDANQSKEYEYRRPRIVAGAIRLTTVSVTVLVSHCQHFRCHPHLLPVHFHFLPVFLPAISFSDRKIYFRKTCISQSKLNFDFRSLWSDPRVEISGVSFPTRFITNLPAPGTPATFCRRLPLIRTLILCPARVRAHFGLSAGSTL